MNEKIERIIAACTRNGVSLNKNFNVTYLSTHGYYEGPQQLAGKALDDLDRLCRLGINAGFDSQLKSAIDKLSDIVIGLTNVKQGDVRELAKADGQRNKILENVREASYPSLDVTKTVNMYVATSVEAIDTIISLSSEDEIFSTVDKRQIEYLNQSKQKLGEINAALFKVMETGSVAAKANAERACELIRKWRLDCSRFMCTSRSVGYLDDAIEVINEWGKQFVAPVKRDKAKELPVFIRDEMSIIADSRAGLETLSVFNARIEARRQELDKQQSEIDKERQTCESLKAQLSALENRKKEIARELMNTGDKNKANRDVAEVRRQSDALEADIKAIEGNGRLAKKEKDLRNRRNVTVSIKHICDMLTDNKSDLVFLAKVLQHVDFNSLVGVMTGRTGDLEEASNSIAQIRVRVENLYNAYVITGTGLEEDQRAVDSVMLDEMIYEEEPQTELNAEGVDAELAELMKAMESGEEKEEATREEVRRIVPLGDDDK